MDTPESVSESLEKFLADSFFIEFGGDVGPKTDLFEAGLLDSFGFVELIAFIEKTYGIKITDDDLESPEISNLAGLQTLIVARMGLATE